jgi:hypothetical protein
MIARTGTYGINQAHKDEVPTDLMRPEDVPGCTPFLEDSSKEQSAQGHASTSVRLFIGLCGVRGGRRSSPEGESVASETATTVYSAVRIALR